MKIQQKELPIQIGKLYIITKLGKVKNPFHPNSDYGDLEPYRIGLYTFPPKVGERFELSAIGPDPKHYGIKTSIVTKIISKNKFETLNSIYQIKPYKI